MIIFDRQVKTESVHCINEKSILNNEDEAAVAFWAAKNQKKLGMVQTH